MRTPTTKQLARLLFGRDSAIRTERSSHGCFAFVRAANTQLRRLHMPSRAAALQELDRRLFVEAWQVGLVARDCRENRRAA